MRLSSIIALGEVAVRKCESSERFTAHDERYGDGLPFSAWIGSLWICEIKSLTWSTPVELQTKNVKLTTFKKGWSTIWNWKVQKLINNLDWASNTAFVPVIHGSYDPMSDLRSEWGDRILRSDVIRVPISNADPDPGSGSDSTKVYDPDPDPAPSNVHFRIRIRIRIRRIFTSKIRLQIRVWVPIRKPSELNFRLILT